jgi:thiosulfate/3-mercaptopyruvate sulfurtransferase
MFFSILTCLLLTGDEPKYAHPEMLVEVAELSDPAKASQFRILDARARDHYAKGHIPGAVWVDQGLWGKKLGNGQDMATWSGLIGALGIGESTKVVVYDEGYPKDAARIWWILRYWGIHDVRLLNGGWAAWEAASAKTSTEIPKVKAEQPKLQARPERLATKQGILEVLKGTKPQIVDARSQREFRGETASAKKNGAIPGAMNTEAVKLLDSSTWRFKDAPELAGLFEEKGIDLQKPTITHCYSGGRSSIMAFALELMGAKDVRNYYSSWHEWGNADDTPVVKPEK